MKTWYRHAAGLLPLLLLCARFVLAQSLSPPPADVVEGQPVPVTAHPRQQTLLQIGSPALQANKQLVYDYWRTVLLGGRLERMEDFLQTDFVEHDPLLPSGTAALRAHLSGAPAVAVVPDTIPGLVTLIAEGEWVVLVQVANYPEPAQPGATYTSARFDLFRLAEGRIAEHWDSTLFRAGQAVPDFGAAAATPTTGRVGLAQHALLASSDPQLFVNKRLAFDLWRQIPEGGQEQLAALYVAPGYLQHNPNAATGREGFVDYMARRPDSAIEPYLETPLVALVAEGDLVVQVLETTRTQAGVTWHVPWFDMFRVEQGLVIEHWDTASKGELPAATPGGPLGL